MTVLTWVGSTLYFGPVWPKPPTIYDIQCEETNIFGKQCGQYTTRPFAQFSRQNYSMVLCREHFDKAVKRADPF